MDEFGLLRDVTIGQYLPGRSVLHRMDPRAKLGALLALLLGVSLVDTYVGSAVLLALVLLLVPLSGIPLGFALRGLRPAAGFLLIVIVFQLLFGGSADETRSQVLWQWEGLPPRITETSLRRSLVLIPRTVSYWVLVGLLTYTTPTGALAMALETLLRPLRVVRVPAHEVAMMFTIALRFVPTIAEETERIMKAQASRGADFGRPGPFQFLHAARRLVPILVPLFVLTFRRAEELILAMESRCYVGGAGRTHLRRFTMRRVDWALLLGACGIAAGFALVRMPL